MERRDLAANNHIHSDRKSAAFSAGDVGRYRPEVSAV